MYFQLSEFYKREICFFYDEDKNPIPFYDFDEYISKQTIETIFYKVDKIDSYINQYDILPTSGPLLVSKKFIDSFSKLIKTEIDYFPANITDDKGITNTDFFALKINNIIPCFDYENSTYEEVDYDDGEPPSLESIELKILNNSLRAFSIVRMLEDPYVIIISNNFKKICEANKLKGFDFIPLD